MKGIGTTSEQFKYDENGNLKEDLRNGHKATYLYDYKNRLVGVRPEKWDVWNQTTYTYPEPGDLQLENGELSFYGNNDTGYKYAEREIPNVTLSIPPNLVKLGFDFTQASGIDMDVFYFYFKNSETGAYFRVMYYERSRDLYIAQYSNQKGYQVIYANTNIDLRSGANCRFEIHFGTVNFYLNNVWKGSASLDPNISSVNSIYILLGEAHYHFDNIKITSSYFGTLSDLKFDDGPYAEYADYVYNTNDERVLTVTSASTSSYYPYKSYIYDGNGKVMAEYKYNKYGTGYLVNNYVYGNGQKLAKVDISETVEYYHNNYLGSVQAITNSSGSTVWSRSYYPFGQDRDATGTGNEYKFTGKEWDEESDLYYFWKRYYNPEVGRFISIDPFYYLSPSLTPYHYCRNNPLVRIDVGGLTDINIYIVRMFENNTATMGNLLAVNSDDFNILHSATVELPGRNNQDEISRINADKYDAELSVRFEEGPRKGQKVIRLDNKNNREAILIHEGSLVEYLKGCIGIGKNMPAWGQTSEGDKTRKSMIDYVTDIMEKDRKNNEKTTINVEVIDPRDDEEDPQ